MATIGSEQISQKMAKAHLDSFNLTRAVVFVGSTAVVTRVKESQAHQARGVLRLFAENRRNFPLGMEHAEEIWTQFSSQFAPAVKEVVEFAKQIPQFMDLDEEDQIQLMKSGAFEVIRVCTGIRSLTIEERHCMWEYITSFFWVHINTIGQMPLHEYLTIWGE